MKSEQSKYLEYCLKTYSMAKVKNQVVLYRQKKKMVADAIKRKYEGQLAGPIIYGGSIAKGTQLNTSYDVDLVIPFKYGVFTLEDLAKDLLKFFRKEFSDAQLDQVRNQRVSVGLTYSKLFGRDIRLDVVPGREVGKGAYRKDKNLMLFDWNEKTHFQTNIAKQIKHVKGSHQEARKVIRLLKIWKENSELSKLKSFAIELLVIGAMKNKKLQTHTDIALLLDHVADHIQSRIETRRLVDPGNSNNVVSNLLSDHQRTLIGREMRKVCKAIRKDDPQIKTLFPINVDYA